MTKNIAFCCATAALLSCFAPKSFAISKENNRELYLLVGTYADAQDNGIFIYRFDTKNGVSKQVSKIDGISNPSYLTVSPNERFVYAVSENEGDDALACSFAFDRKYGKLTAINSQRTRGGSPCYINTDASGRHIITANYSGGNISVFDTKKDGSLLPTEQVIEFNKSSNGAATPIASKLHCVMFSPDGKTLFADDLGKDKIHKFTVDYSAKADSKSPFLKLSSPEAFDIEKGSGPRHLTFHPNKKFAYLINELSGKVTAFSYDKGNLKSIQYIASDVTEGINKKGSADIHISPDGKFLYASNRLKNDGIAIFKINTATGLLTKVGYQLTGIHPRNFIITPNGKFLLCANRDSNSIQVFAVNKRTGLLKDTKLTIDVSKPVCLKFAKIVF